MQTPVFEQSGIDLSDCWPGTINLSFAPLELRLKDPDHCFQQLHWTDLHPPETFSFWRIGLITEFDSAPVAGSISLIRRQSNAIGSRPARLKCWLRSWTVWCEVSPGSRRRPFPNHSCGWCALALSSAGISQIQGAGSSTILLCLNKEVDQRRAWLKQVWLRLSPSRMPIWRRSGCRPGRSMQKTETQAISRRVDHRASLSVAGEGCRIQCVPSPSSCAARISRGQPLC